MLMHSNRLHMFWNPIWHFTIMYPQYSTPENVRDDQLTFVLLTLFVSSYKVNKCKLPHIYMFRGFFKTWYTWSQKVQCLATWYMHSFLKIISLQPLAVKVISASNPDDFVCRDTETHKQLASVVQIFMRCIQVYWWYVGCSLPMIYAA